MVVSVIPVGAIIRLWCSSGSSRRRSEHEETYDLNWLGKRRALQLINKGCWQQMHSGLD